MYDTSFRLRGKTYDYKIQYEAIKKFMVLPKPDELHFMLCIGLDPPLRQGQTRYPFIIMQYKQDEEATLDLNITEEELEGKYKDKLQRERFDEVGAVVKVLNAIQAPVLGTQETQVLNTVQRCRVRIAECQ